MSENPHTLCARSSCRQPRSEHKDMTGRCEATDCPEFEYDANRDMMDYYEGAHSGHDPGGIGQDSARRMMWGD
jgi:hypothetical protein